MAQIAFRLIGKGYRGGFSWHGIRADAEDNIEIVRQNAEELGRKFTDYLHETMTNLAPLLSSADAEDRSWGRLVTTVACLDMPTKNLSGRIIDHLDRYDFFLTLAEDDSGGLTVNIKEELRTAGSA